MSIGLQEWVIIFLIVVVLFGGTQIPRLFRGLGQGIKEFKTAVKESDAEPEKKDDAAAAEASAKKDGESK